MECKIIKQEKNPFLNREELILEIKNDIATSLDEIKTEIGRDVNLTVIKKVNSNFGREVIIVEAVVYDSKEAMEKIETVPRKVRMKMAEEKKAAYEAAKKAEAEEAVVEVSAEETKVPVEEETKEEGKTE